MQTGIKRRGRAVVRAAGLGLVTLALICLGRKVGGGDQRAFAMPSHAIAAASKRPPPSAPAHASSDVDHGDGDDAQQPAPACEQPKAKAQCHGGFCRVEAGCFSMGSGAHEWGRAAHGDDPAPVRLVHAFRIQEDEMTQGEWKRLGLHNPSGRMQDGTGDCQRDDCPVGNLTWFEALEFANLRSTREGVSACYALSQCSGEIGYGRTCEDVRSVDASIYDCPGYRLPTSAEWEYAARAGVSSSVYSGEIVAKGPMFSCYDEPVLSSIAWYCANAGALTHPVGKKRANGWGLHDMIGNAGEWVGLLSRSGEDEHPALDVIDSSTHGALAQWRGGAWNLWPHMLRAAAASNDPPNARGPGIGFRLAQTVAAIARSEPRVARSRARH